MEILFVSDYVCPYCLVAKEALRQALSLTGQAAQITFLPLELTPEPRERVDTYHDEIRKARYQVLVEPCRQLGLDMKLPPRVIPRPYTRLAFEGWFYACDHGCGDAYNDLVYRAYFTEELDIGQISVLASLAARIGLDADDFTDALNQGRYTETEQEAVRTTRATLDPRSVPAIYLDGVRIHPKDYTVSEMVRLLNDHGFSASGGSFACGPDGC